jgi:hypothetical protein
MRIVVLSYEAFQERRRGFAGEDYAACGGWRGGACPTGHWWLRDGELVPA